MKRLLHILLFFYTVSCFAQIRYVTTSGSSGNSGTTEGSAWSLSHAIGNATAGMTVHVKAGNYGSSTYTQNNDGTSSNPIKFIGYDNSINDIDPDLQVNFTLGPQTIKRLAAFQYGDNVNSGTMPLLTTSGNTGTFLNVNGDYVHFYNFQFSGRNNSMWVSGNNGTFKNIISLNTGNLSSATYTGSAIQNRGNNATWKNVYVEDSGAQSFTVRGTGGNFDGISLVCDNTGNPTDYYFLFQETNNNYASNIFVRRVGNLSHGGHGIVLKTPDPCYNNVIEDFIIQNTFLEPQFPGVHDNEMRRGYVVNEDGIWTRSGLRTANGAYSNLFEDIYFKNGSLKFADWNDGLTGDVADSADNNVFNRVTVDGGRFGIAFNYFDGHQTGDWSGSADNNTFYNCTFVNVDYLFENSRPNSNTQLINCIIDNVGGFSTKGAAASPGFSINESYNTCNFSNNGFSTPSGTNVTTQQPQFALGSGFDYSLSESSPLKGDGIATPFMSAGNDLGAAQETTGSNPTCNDGIQNGDETGVDCGGSCQNSCSGNSPPTAITIVSTGTNNADFNENTVNPNVTLQAADVDPGETFTFTKNGGGNDPSFFSISGSTLTLNLTPDFENSQDSNTNNLYALDVQVEDSAGNTFVENIYFRILDVDEASDITTPSITAHSVSNITETSFRVSWSLDEGSQGRIRFGTTSGVYTSETALETRYLTSHVQTVGDSNPNPLTANTTYYYQIYLEDAAANSGWSSEYSTTTAGEGTDPDPPPSLAADGRALFIKKKKF